MSDNVVPLQPGDKPDVIWVCSCGCSTFLLHAHGGATCAACDLTPVAEQGGWTPPDTDAQWDGDDPVRDVQGNASVEFARRRLVQMAGAEDAVAVVVVRGCGTIHAWSCADTAERLAWLKERLEAAHTLIARPVGSGDAG